MKEVGSITTNFTPIFSNKDEKEQEKCTEFIFNLTKYLGRKRLGLFGEHTVLFQINPLSSGRAHVATAENGLEKGTMSMSICKPFLNGAFQFQAC